MLYIHQEQGYFSYDHLKIKYILYIKRLLCDKYMAEFVGPMNSVSTTFSLAFLYCGGWKAKKYPAFLAAGGGQVVLANEMKADARGKLLFPENNAITEEEKTFAVYFTLPFFFLPGMLMWLMPGVSAAAILKTWRQNPPTEDSIAEK